MAIRQQDLARRLKLSQGTVSKALRGDTDIRPEVREAVLTAATKLGYDLGKLAPPEAIIPRETGIICADIPRSGEWHERVLDGVIAAARESGHEVMVAAHAEEELPRVVTRGQVDGLVRLMASSDFRKQPVVAAPVPTVSILFPIPGADVVSVDHFGSAYDLGLHLGSLRPGIAAHIGFSDWLGKTRLAGLRCGLEECGATLPPDLVRFSHALQPTVTRPLIDQLLALRAAGRPEHQFTLLTCYNDFVARHAVEILRERGLRVPEDIGVTGYDDYAMPVAADLQLTTVHLPLEELGAEAVRRLHWRLSNPQAAPLHWLLKTRVIAGNSVLMREG